MRVDFHEVIAGGLSCLARCRAVPDKLCVVLESGKGHAELSSSALRRVKLYHMVCGACVVLSRRGLDFTSGRRINVGLSQYSREQQLPFGGPCN